MNRPLSEFRSRIPAALLLVSFFCLLCTPVGATPQFIPLHDFAALSASGTNADGASPSYGTLTDSDGTRFGMASTGGANGTGAIFSIAADGTETTVYSFSSLGAGGANADGANPVGGFVSFGNGTYGVCSNGGANGYGTVFQFINQGGAASIRTLVNFTGTTGASLGSAPVGIVVDGDSFYGVTNRGGTGNMGTVFTVSYDGGTVTTLVNFAGTNGSNPDGGLLYDTAAGVFYGTTAGGGSSHGGTVFQMTPSGVLTPLVNFNGVDGAQPTATLTLGSNGDFYGTTESGGANGTGTIFQLTPSGTLTTLHRFASLPGGSDNSDGANPVDALVEGLDGNFYGTARNGGALGNGTVFKVTPAGTLTTLVTFTGASGATPGASPYGGLVFGSDGNLYGTTAAGGLNGTGTVFSILAQSQMLYSFSALSNGSSGTNSDGGFPSLGNLTLGSDGNFYGVTSRGGPAGNGTIYRITPAGTLTTLHAFSALSNGTYGTNSDGAFVQGALALGRDGNLYGTTGAGGTSAAGTVFKITPDGMLTTLTDFASGEGPASYVGLVLGSDGNFYGLTSFSVFQVTPGGSLTSLANFDVGYPKAGLALGPDGNLYGSTFSGGSTSPNNPDMGDGTLFEVVLTGPLAPTVQIVINFTGSNGIHPICVPVFGSDGTLYGTTQFGGPVGSGTVFQVSPSGTLTTITSFPDPGINPPALDAGVTFGTDGDLYGTTQLGGTYNAGTVYRTTLSGTLTTLVSFTNNTGADPYSGLMLDTNGDFYGTTNQGGANGTGTVYRVIGPPGGYGAAKTATENTPATFTVAFNDPSGLGIDSIAFPTSPAHGTLTLGAIAETGTTGTVTLTYTPATGYVGTDSFTYTVTGATGTSGPQTVTVAIAPAKPTITGVAPTSAPVGTMVTITGTNLTGTTVVGFQNAHAVSFTVNAAGTQITTTVPAGAATGPIAVLTNGVEVKSATSFIVTASQPAPTISGVTPASGPVGTTVTITGTNLTGASVLGFQNAHAMSFTVNGAGTQITTTVPPGAATGPIAVLTPGGQAKSSTNFMVTVVTPKPTITGFSPMSGPIGTTVTIAGTNLTGTTVVGFQGQHAKSFTVNGAGTQITTTVPTGASTGPIAVLTPGGQAKSGTSFTVTP